uniref:Uncharacterized protein n=1 Tax=Arundo donax TaxID=35708 RepID=A0A0A9EZS5_ARUDO
MDYCPNPMKGFLCWLQQTGRLT